MIESLIKTNRRLRIEYSSILKLADSEGVAMLRIIESYLSDYCIFLNLTPNEVEKIYTLFVEKYVSDFKEFKETGKYPFELGNNKSIDRTSYDIALLLSVFFIPVRYHIFRKAIDVLKKTTGNILIIGVGAGMEVELITKMFPGRELIAYDLTIGKFVKERFFQGIIHEKEFLFDISKLYDNILVIELLEHLVNPYKFIQQSSGCLSNGGTLVCTTASNMPQFDHLFNFYKDDFDQKIKELNLNIEYKEELKHSMLNPEVLSFNTFYHLVKLQLC